MPDALPSHCSIFLHTAYVANRNVFPTTVSHKTPSERRLKWEHKQHMSTCAVLHGRLQLVNATVYYVRPEVHCIDNVERANGEI